MKTLQIELPESVTDAIRLPEAEQAGRLRVGAAEYERIEEDSWSHLDMEVHEHPVIEGSVGEIKATDCAS